MRRRLAAAQEWACADCAQLLDALFQVDHIRPLGIGGADVPANMQCLCVQCHASKTLWDVRCASALRLGRHEVACPRCGDVASVHFRHRCD